MQTCNTVALSTGVLQVQLLGAWEVRWQDQALGPLRYDKPRALLAYLIVHSRQLHGREPLAELLWPDLAGDRARSNLRRALHELRTFLTPSGCLPDAPAPDFLLSSKHQLGWNPSSCYHLDVDAFTAPAGPDTTVEQLEQQLALYRGDFLSGLQLAQSPEFETWVDTQRQALRQQAQQLTIRLAHAHESLGQPERALQLLQQAITLDPWQEETHRHTMRLLAKQQRTSAAMEQYETCKALLQRELGIEPEPATQALALAIRRGELRHPAGSRPPPARTPVLRHQVCILACELRARPHSAVELETTALAESLGACLDVLTTRGGHGIAPQAGLVLAYFGYPKAQEHAPRKALEAALELAQRTAPEHGLSIRMGAHSGWIMVDPRVHLPDATGQLTRHTQALAQSVDWGEIAISPELAHQVEGYFQVQPLPPGSAWPGMRLLQRTASVTRLQAASGGLTPFIGRVVEQRQLRLLWEQTRRGECIARWLSGEAGIGKSRLLHALQEHALDRGGHVLVLQCQPEFLHTPYYPWIDQLTRQPALAEHAPAVSALLFQPDTLNVPPADLQQATQAALLELVCALARQHPLMLVVEDLHWADASTLEWLQLCLKTLTAPVLLLLSSRDPQAPWPQLRTLPLRPLSTRQSEQFIRQMLGTEQLDAPSHHRVLQRCDGIPLYIEEMVRTVQSGLDHATNGLPGNIGHLLAARLESVGPASRLARQAACLGRDFDTGLLSDVWDGEPGDLPVYLAHLAQAGLLQALNPEHYRFSHALVQDAAYQTLALAERQRIHGRLALLYQGPYRERLSNAPERLAQHLALAGEPLAAAAAWLDAGRLAASRSANQDACFHFESGLAQLRSLAPENASSAISTELALQAALGTTLMAIQGYGTLDAKACFTRALELSRQAGDKVELFPVMWGMWLGGRSCTPEAYPLELAERLEQIATASGDPEQAMQMHYAFGNNLFWMGRYPEAMSRLDQAIRLGRDLPAARRIRLYGEDTAISSLSFCAWIHWLQGRPATAIQTARTAVAQARALQHAHTLGFALTFAAVLHRFLDQPDASSALAQELLAHAREHHLLLWQVAGSAVAGWADARRGQRQALEGLAQCVQAARQAMLAVETTFMAFQVDALWHLQDYRACAELAQITIANSHRYNDLYFQPEFLRLQGLSLLQLGQQKEGLDCLDQALALATGQGAKALELRVLDALIAARPASASAALRLQRNAVLHGCPELQACTPATTAPAAQE
nr:AAA family ATPase [uncultured Rhodoferax sp.]